MLPKCGISKMLMLSIAYEPFFQASGKIIKAPNHKCGPSPAIIRDVTATYREAAVGKFCSHNRTRHGGFRKDARAVLRKKRAATF
jgi:hypothetical protein